MGLKRFSIISSRLDVVAGFIQAINTPITRRLAGRHTMEMVHGWRNIYRDLTTRLAKRGLEWFTGLWNGRIDGELTLVNLLFGTTFPSENVARLGTGFSALAWDKVIEMIAHILPPTTMLNAWLSLCFVFPDFQGAVSSQDSSCVVPRTRHAIVQLSYR